MCPTFALNHLTLFPKIFLFKGISQAKLQEIKKAMELLNLNIVHQGPAKTADEAARKHFEFWDTQPVPKIGILY